jgi:hypothetical protein
VNMVMNLWNVSSQEVSDNWLLKNDCALWSSLDGVIHILLR